MPRRDWESYLANQGPLIALLIVLSLTFINGGPTQPEGNEQQPNASGQNEGSRTPRGADPGRSAEIQKAETQQNKVDCRYPQNTEEGNFCQQRRAADIAAQSYSLSYLQTVIGGLGLVFVGVTLLYNARAARGAIEAAKATRDQVELSRLAMVTTERAVVICKVIDHRWWRDRQTNEMLGWFFYAKWENVGRSPTRAMCAAIFGQTRIDVAPLPIESDLAEFEVYTQEPIYLGPGAQMVSSEMYFPTDTLIAAKSGAALLYVWGWADYNDVFAGTPRHRTEFCVAIEVRGDPTRDDCRFAFRAYGPFNGFDEECRRKPRPYDQGKAVAPS